MSEKKMFAVAIPNTGLHIIYASDIDRVAAQIIKENIPLTNFDPLSDMKEVPRTADGGYFFERNYTAANGICKVAVSCPEASARYCSSMLDVYIQNLDRALGVAAYFIYAVESVREID